MMNTNGFTVWLTGMSGTGKTTMADYLAARLRQVGRNVEVLDEEEVAASLWNGIGDSKDERNQVVRRLGYVSNLLSRNGVAVLVAAGVAVAVRMAAHRSAPSDEPVVRTNRYEVGSCVTISPGPMVSILSCGRPNSGRVKATTDYPRPCPSGTETVSVVAEQVSVCLSGTSPSPGDLPGS